MLLRASIGLAVLLAFVAAVGPSAVAARSDDGPDGDDDRAPAAPCYAKTTDALSKRFIEARPHLAAARGAAGDGASARGLLVASGLRADLETCLSLLLGGAACHDECVERWTSLRADAETIRVELDRVREIGPVRLAGRLTPLVPDGGDDREEILLALPDLEEQTASVVPALSAEARERARADVRTFARALMLMGVGDRKSNTPSQERAVPAKAIAAAREALVRRRERLELEDARDRAAAKGEGPVPVRPAHLEADVYMRVGMGLGMGTGRLLAFGEQLVRETRAEIEWLAHEQLGASSALEALQQARRDAPAPADPDDATAMARAEVANAVAFLRERGMATLPDDVVANLDVERVPQLRLGFGNYRPAGWGSGRAAYVVSFPPKDADERDGRREANFEHWTRVVAVHETYPGHHLHFDRSRREASPLRRRGGYEAQVVEGWGFLSERLMFEAGYFDEEPRDRLAYLGMRLWRAARVVVDARLLRGEWTVDQAAAFHEHEGLLQADDARDQARRQVARRGYFSCYAVGAMKLAALRDELVEREMARGTARRDAERLFVDRLVTAGTSAPIEAVRIAVLETR